jgi:hypothetical protein
MFVNTHLRDQKHALASNTFSQAAHQLRRWEIRAHGGEMVNGESQLASLNKFNFCSASGGGIPTSSSCPHVSVFDVITESAHELSRLCFCYRLGHGHHMAEGENALS